MTKKYYWDPVKKVMDVVQFFSSKPKAPAEAPPPHPPVPRPTEGTPTRRMFPDQPPPGDTTRFYGSPPKEAPPSEPPPQRTPEPPTRRMAGPPEKLPPAPQRPGAGRLDRFKPLGSRLPPEETLRGVPKDKIFSREELEMLKKAGRKSWWSRLGLRGQIGMGLATMAIGMLLWGGIDWAFSRAQEKMGASADLTALMPQNNRVDWISAPYGRRSRDAANPFWEPNVFQEAVTINPPYDGVMAFGISVSGLPEEFTNDVDVNNLGNGNSDWLCEPFQGYLVCRSLGSFPLQKGVAAKVTMQFHLPADEMKKYLASPAGTRRVYVVVPRQR